MTKYRAILISDNLVLSYEIGETIVDSPIFLASYVAKQSRIRVKDIDTILVLENGPENPNVVHHYEPHCWSE